MLDNSWPQERRPLCPSCSKDWVAWLGYKITPPINLVQIGKPTAARIREAQEARFRQWRDTVAFQQGLIERICADQQHDLGDDPS